MNHSLNVNVIAALVALRDAVLEAEPQVFGDFDCVTVGPEDWREIQRFARAAKGKPVTQAGVVPVDGGRVERIDAEDLAEAYRANEIEGRRCRLHKARRWCSFPWGHPGVHSWDVQVEPIHHTTGKPAKKRGAK